MIIAIHVFKGNLNQHVASVHEGKKPFKRDICDYSCLRKDRISQHYCTQLYINKHTIASVHEKDKFIKFLKYQSNTRKTQ